MSDLEAKLKKIYALAKNGAGGEKDAAQLLLDRILKKHNLKIEDILSGDDAEHKCMYICKNEWEQDLSDQIVYSIYGKDQPKMYGVRRTQKRFFNCSIQEKTEFLLMYDILKASWKEELRTFYNAFIQTNKVFPAESGKSPDKQYTAEERAEIHKMFSYAENIKRSQFRKQLESK